jgi:hypothetical protein
MEPMNQTVNFLSRKRGPRSKSRDDQRDVVMRMVFSKPGFASEIAKHLRVTPQNVSNWKRVPVHHVHTIAPLLGLTPEQIRPDIFRPSPKR